MPAIESGAPFFFAAGTPPTATAIDDDIYLTVTAAMPDVPGEIESIDIILSVEAAKRTIVELQKAIDGAADAGG
jgi:hypothetical protein